MVNTTPSLAGSKNGVVEDVVAVAVTLETGERRYFMTWGRIQDTVDPEPLEALILEHASRVALGGTATSAEVCSSLAAAAAEPYFLRSPPFLRLVARTFRRGIPGVENGAPSCDE